MGNALAHGSYLNLDYVYGTLSNADGENPLDYPALRDNPMDYYAVATNALTGEAHYFGKADMRQDCYDILKASSAIPVGSKPYTIGGVPYFDGALADSVPLDFAFELGCDRVVVILTKPRDTVRDPKNDEPIARLIQKKYPHAAERMRSRAKLYNDSVARAKACERDGRALIVAPNDTCGMNTLTKKRGPIDQLYRKGYADGSAIERAGWGR